MIKGTWPTGPLSSASSSQKRAILRDSMLWKDGMWLASSWNTLLFMRDCCWVQFNFKLIKQFLCLSALLHFESVHLFDLLQICSRNTSRGKAFQQQERDKKRNFWNDATFFITFYKIPCEEWKITLSLILCCCHVTFFVFSSWLW